MRRIIRALMPAFICSAVLQVPASGGITVDAEAPSRPASPYLFGSQISWTRQGGGTLQGSYGTLRLPVARSPFVMDVLDQLGPSTLRFHGDNVYNFRDGIGPHSRRPGRRFSKYGDSIWANDFGTDEFLSLCESVGAEPVIVAPYLAVRSHVPDAPIGHRLAANWVEYCNGVSPGLGHGATQGWQPTTWSEDLAALPEWRTGARYPVGAKVQKNKAVFTCFRRHTAEWSNSPGSAYNWKEYWTEVPVVESSEPGHSWLSTEPAPAGYFAWLREYFGRAEPYGVKYWEIGNEVHAWDNTIAGNLWAAPTAYRDNFLRFVADMKTVDPTVQLGIALPGKRDPYLGNYYPWHDAWMETVLGVPGSYSQAYQSADFLVWHVECSPDEANAADPEAEYTRLFQMTRVFEQAHAEFMDAYPLPVMITENNVRYGLYFGANPVYQAHQHRLKSALAYASLLNQYIRLGVFGVHQLHLAEGGAWYPTQAFRMAFEDTSEITGSPRTGVTPTFLAIRLYSRLGRGDALSVTLTDEPGLDAAAIREEGPGRVRLFVVNQSSSEARAAQVRIQGLTPAPLATAFTLTGGAGMESFNEHNPMTVEIREAAFSPEGPEFEYVFPAHSLTVLDIGPDSDGPQQMTGPAELPPSGAEDSGPFTDIDAGLTGLDLSGLAWGDYDADGDPDIAVAGWTGTSHILSVYRNEAGAFQIHQSLTPGAGFAALDWADFDRDGDLDLAVSGYSGSRYANRVYVNEAGMLSATPTLLAGGTARSVEWGDLDNDGDPDLAMTVGALDDDGQRVSQLYRTDGGMMNQVAWGLTRVDHAAVDLADYDRDGDLDIALAGYTGNIPISRIYRNRDGAVQDTGFTLPQGANASVAWGNVDGDEYPDLAISGHNGQVPFAQVLRSIGGLGFIDTSQQLPGVFHSSLAWGDYDNDGDEDLALCGYTGSRQLTAVYRNDGGVLTDSGADLPGVNQGCLRWADYDLDGDLDLAVTGSGITRIFRNNTTAANTPPQPPSNLHGAVSGVDVTFSWAPGSDMETPQAALRYELRVGLSPGPADVFFGKCGTTQRWILKGLQAADYHFSVRAVDSAGGVSEWADGGTVRVSGLSISGSVLGPGGEPLAGVLVDADGLGGSGVSGPDGAFELSVPEGWSGTLTASRTNWWFLPHRFPVGPLAAPFAGVTFRASTFQEVPVSLPRLIDGSIAWGDMDGDGDMDLAVAGQDSTGKRSASVFRNAGASFVDTKAALPGANHCALAWGDYDGDGDLDLAIAGFDGTARIAHIYANNAGSFADSGVVLPGVEGCALAWADADSDGDLDLAIAGYTGAERIARVYHNSGGTFRDGGSELEGVEGCSLAWGDYDGDGDPDLLSAGFNGSTSVTRLYRNDSGQLSDSGLSLPGVDGGAVAFGDYDGDGDPDLAIAGHDASQKRIARVLRNDGGPFVDSGAVLTGLGDTALAWGDLDSDGDLDLTMSGFAGSFTLAKTYLNDGGAFVPIGTGTAAVDRCGLALGDMDADGDLDLALVGSGVCKVYANRAGLPNTPPAAPPGFEASFANGTLRLSWKPSTDAESPSSALTYNIRVGTRPGSRYIAPGQSLASGARLLPAAGNAGQRLEASLRDLPAGRLYCAVQAVDATFAGSAWTEEVAVDVVPRAFPDGAEVALGPAVVTAVFPGEFYAEAEDRAWGIRVHGAGVEPGRKVTVRGTIGTTTDGERFVDAESVQDAGPGSVLPLQMRLSWLGGSDWEYDGSTGSGQRGVTDGTGLNNIGLLVRVAGRVRAPQDDSFMLSDGSGATVRCLLPDGATPPAEGEFVSVTGISSCYRTGDDLYPLVRATQIQMLSSAESPADDLEYAVFDPSRDAPHPPLTMWIGIQ